MFELRLVSLLEIRASPKDERKVSGNIKIIPVVRVYFASLMRLCVIKNLTQIPVYDSMKLERMTNE